MFSFRHRDMTYKKLFGNIKLGGIRMSSKKSRRTRSEVNVCFSVSDILVQYSSCHTRKHC